MRTMKNTPQVSIVVACRNEASHIEAFLDSLLAQDLPESAWEAILADGMSDDGTCVILNCYAARNPQLRVVANPRRIVSTGLNAAIRAARGEIILRMDAHTRYAADYCRCCLETLERTGAENVGGPARTESRGLRARAIAAAFHSRFSTGGTRFHDVTYEGWVDTVPYGCWYKSTLDRIGLFDEELVRNQDDELNLRLTRAGGRVWQDPGICSWYSSRSKLLNLFRQYLQYGFWKVAVIRKHRMPASWRHLIPVVFLIVNLILLAGLAVSHVAGAADWYKPLVIATILVIGTYISATLAASIFAAQRNGWALLPYLPAVFVTFHLSYGVGFLAGLIHFSRPSPRHKPTADSAFARMSR